MGFPPALESVPPQRCKRQNPRLPLAYYFHRLAEKSCRFRDVPDIYGVSEPHPFPDENPAPPARLSDSLRPAPTGTALPMNRFDLTFPPDAPPAPLPPQFVFQFSAPAQVTGLPESGATALITRRQLPGTSIRRLRHHRCAWPKRS